MGGLYPRSAALWPAVLRKTQVRNIPQPDISVHCQLHSSQNHLPIYTLQTSNARTLRHQRTISLVLAAEKASKTNHLCPIRRTILAQDFPPLPLSTYREVLRVRTQSSTSRWITADTTLTAGGSSSGGDGQSYLLQIPGSIVHARKDVWVGSQCRGFQTPPSSSPRTAKTGKAPSGRGVVVAPSAPAGSSRRARLSARSR